MFGGAHSNTYQNLFKACQAACSTTTNPSNNAFDFIIGGGIDIPVGRHIAIRPAQLDFVLTRFGNGFTKGNQNQSNFRYNGGIVLRFVGSSALEMLLPSLSRQTLTNPQKNAGFSSTERNEPEEWGVGHVDSHTISVRLPLQGSTSH